MQIFELITVINEISPFSGAFSDDKVGLLIGKSESEVSSIIFAHDIDKKLLKICKEKNINTVLTYHPAVFNDYEDLSYKNSYGLPLDFLKLDINVISLHTALDVCKGGNSDVLAELFNLQNITFFTSDSDLPINNPTLSSEKAPENGDISLITFINSNICIYLIVV